METLHARERSFPASESERDSIRNQLERMLSDPLFRNSKRFPALLRHVVEQTLEGHGDELKERTLGIEVFARQPNYDTNADPIVRATAGEIRKRIAQYYHAAEHQSEIRIDLSPGSYVPEFHGPAIQPGQPAAIPDADMLRPAKPFRFPLLAFAIPIAAALAGIVIGVAWSRPKLIHTALDQFWGPALESPLPVLICIGQRAFLAVAQEPGRTPNPDIPLVAESRSNPAARITMSELYYMGSQNVALHDVQTLARMAGLLEARGRSFRILGGSSTSFADLRSGPVILLGGFNNDWTMRLTGPMRFSFERDGTTFWIRDRQNPGKKDLAVNYSAPYQNLVRDYALISRVLDPTTDRMVVIAGGLTGFGTVAAGEFLTDPRHFENAIKQAPRDWDRKNIQLVIATEVIDGNSGPPRVVDRFFW